MLKPKFEIRPVPEKYPIRADNSVDLTEEKFRIETSITYSVACLSERKDGFFSLLIEPKSSLKEINVLSTSP